MILSSPTSPGIQKWESEGDCVGWIFHSKQKKQADPKQKSFLGLACRRSQCPSVEQAVFQREGSYLGGMKEASDFKLNPHLPSSGAGSRCSQGHFSLHFSLLQGLGALGVCRLKKEKCSAASDHKAICPKLPLISLVLTSSYLPPTFPFSYTQYQPMHTHTGTPLIEMDQREGPSLMKTDFRLEKLHLF